MGERKVQNVYIPPDFDPSKVPKATRAKVAEIRMMMPFSGQCTACSEFLPRGKKFNSKLERIEGEDYLGVRVYRFIGKCPRCSSFYSFKTDPKNLNYAPEYGVKRNFETWRGNQDEEAARAAAAAAEAKLDAVVGLEARTLESKRQMDMLDALDALHARRVDQAHIAADPDALLAAVLDMREEEEAGGSNGAAGSGSSGGNSGAGVADEEEDAELVARIFAAKRRAALMLAGAVSLFDEAAAAPSLATAAADSASNAPAAATVARRPGHFALSHLNEEAEADEESEVASELRQVAPLAVSGASTSAAASSAAAAPAPVAAPAPLPALAPADASRAAMPATSALMVAPSRSTIIAPRLARGKVLGALAPKLPQPDHLAATSARAEAASTAHPVASEPAAKRQRRAEEDKEAQVADAATMSPVPPPQASSRALVGYDNDDDDEAE